MAVSRYHKQRALGERLLKLRTTAGLSQRQVAARMGCKAAYVGHIESGRRHRLTMQELLSYLGAVGSEDQQLRRELVAMWRDIRSQGPRGTAHPEAQPP